MINKGTFIAGILAALFGGILLGILLSPKKKGTKFCNNRFILGNHNDCRNESTSLPPPGPMPHGVPFTVPVGKTEDKA